VVFRSIVILITSALALVAQDDTAKRIDKIFEPRSKTDVPGVAVAVIQGGNVIYKKGYGAANLEYDIPVTPDTIFHVASVSKQFTAMALVLLEQDGKLSIDNDVHKYMIKLPDYGHKVTIRNLLQHTSGIRDQWETLQLAGWRMDDVITQNQILRMLYHQKELNFEPGTRHLYSNGGFTLAAEIVAHVSGKPFPKFCEERIFRPLGMTRTHFHDDHRMIVRDRAYSYDKTNEGFEISPLNYANVGATSLFTTAPDLVKWLDNFRDPKVGGPKAIARLQEEAVLTDGKKVGYALGLAVGDYRGLRTISHGGGDAGYRSFVLWFPDEKLGVAVVSNFGGFNPSRAYEVAEVYLDQKMSKPAEKPKPAERKYEYITVAPGVLNQYAGSYLVRQGLLDIVVKDGKLLGAPRGDKQVELKPIGAHKFYAEPIHSEVEFTPGAAGKMAIKFTGRESGDGERIVETSSKDLAPYVGAYWSDELETQYTVELNDGKLSAMHAHHGQIVLTPLANDQFLGSQYFFHDVKFVRDADGRITAMTVGGGRVTAVKFTRR